MIDYSQKELLILAFDHRASFLEKMFGIKNRPPTAEEKKQIEDYKKIKLFHKEKNIFSKNKRKFFIEIQIGKILFFLWL